MKTNNIILILLTLGFISLCLYSLWIYRELQSEQIQLTSKALDRCTSPMEVLSGISTFKGLVK